MGLSTARSSLFDLKRLDSTQSQLSLSPFLQLKAKPSALRPNHVTSTNLTHLGAICRTAADQSDVVAVLAPFPRSARDASEASNLIVDVVADGGATWSKVVARSARGLHFTWAGNFESIESRR